MPTKFLPILSGFLFFANALFGFYTDIKTSSVSDQGGSWDWQPSSRSSFPYNYDSGNNDYIYGNLRIENNRSYTVWVEPQFRWTFPDGSTHTESFSKEAVPSGYIWAWWANYGYTPTWPVGTGSVQIRMKEWVNGQTDGFKTVATRNFTIIDKKPDVYKLTPSKTSAKIGDTIDLTARVSGAANYSVAWSSSENDPGWTQPSSSQHDNTWVDGDYQHSNSYVIPDSAAGKNITLTCQAASSGGSDSFNVTIGVAAPEANFEHNMTPKAAIVDIGEVTSLNDAWTVINNGDPGSSCTYTFSESCDWLSILPSSGTLEYGNIVDIDLDFDSTGLEPGDYTCTVSLSSSDPDFTTYTEDVTLSVSPSPNPDWSLQNSEILDLGPYEPGQLIPYQIEVINLGTAVAPASRMSIISSNRNTDVDRYEQAFAVPSLAVGESHLIETTVWCGPNTDLLYVEALANIDNLDELDDTNNRTYLFNSSSDSRVIPTRLFGNTEIKTGFSGDPVNTATGNFVHHSTDLSINSRINDFTFTRFYNSAAEEVSALGRGWRHSFMYELDLSMQGFVGVIFPDGRSEYWNEQSGNYEPQFPQIFNRIEKDGDGWKLIKKDLAEVYFDSTGKCSGYADKNGNAVAFTYTEGNLTSVIDPAGRTLSLSYASSKLVQVKDWTDRSVKFSYTGDNLTGVTDTKGNNIILGYDTGSHLNLITDQRGIDVLSLVYDSEGRAISQADGAGHVTEFAYDTPAAFSTTITNPEGGTMVHAHNEAFQLLQVIDELGRIVTYTYDTTTGLRDSIADKDGNPPTTFSYDSRGNLLQTTFPDTTTEKYTYTADDLPHTKTDQASKVTTWTYDGNGNVETETDPLGNARVWTYNGFGQKETETDRTGAVTTYAYDGVGRLTREEDADGVGESYGYDSLWRRTTVTDDRGNETTTIYNADDTVSEVQRPIGTFIYTYDEVGNRRTEQDSLGNTTTFEYDNNSNRTKVILPNSLGTTTYDYDSLNRLSTTTDGRGKVWTRTYYDDGRLHKEIDPLGNETTYTYDANGNIQTEVDGSGRAMTYVYDVMNRRITATDDESNVTTYDYEDRGLRTSITDPRGNETVYTYDDLRRLSSVRVKAPNAVDDAVTTYAYDNEGRLRTVTDAEGSVWENQYSTAGRRVKRIDGLSRETTFDYDAVGNLEQITYPNAETESYTYDQNNRKVGLSYSDGRNATYTLDAHGNTIQLADWVGTTTYAYDALNRLTSVTDPFGKVVQYGYDLAGNRTTITYPTVGTLTYTYDDRNALSRVTDWNAQEVDYTHDGALRLLTRSFPNGIDATYLYDNAGRLNSLSYDKGATNLLSYSLTLDGNGNPTALNTSGLPSIDSLYSKNLSYSHDAAHQMTASSESTYAYDSRGAMSQREQPGGLESSFDFTADGMLKAYSSIDGTSVENAFDANRMRLSADRNGTETRFVLDRQRGMANVIAETDASGTPNRYFIHGDQTLAMVNAAGAATHYYLTDPFGNVAALADASGSVSDTYRYDPYGNVIGRSGATDNPFKFVGGYGVMSEPGGLFFMRARYYDPEQGRFISVDPLEGDMINPVTMHRYLYAANNSYFYMDPDGEAFFTFGTVAAFLAVKKAVVVATPWVVKTAWPAIKATGSAKVIPGVKKSVEVGLWVYKISKIPGVGTDIDDYGADAPEDPDDDSEPEIKDSDSGSKIDTVNLPDSSQNQGNIRLNPNEAPRDIETRAKN